MAEEQINDFLLDQELEPDDVGGDNELPDDIDAILDAVADEDIATAPDTDEDEALYADDTNPNHDPLNDTIGAVDDEFITAPNDLQDEVNIAAGDMGEESIPLLGEVIDPNNPPTEGGNSVMTLGDDMMFEIMAKIQHVVEQSVNNEIGKLASTVRDNVVQDVKEQLPGLLSEVLKGK
jgi:hypothetical protein